MSTQKKFGIKIFEIDFVIEIKCYLTFSPLPRAPGGGAKKFAVARPRAPGGGAKKFAVARPIHVSISHTKFG